VASGPPTCRLLLHDSQATVHSNCHLVLCQIKQFRHAHSSTFASTRMVIFTFATINRSPCTSILSRLRGIQPRSELRAATRRPFRPCLGGATFSAVENRRRRQQQQRLPAESRPGPRHWQPQTRTRRRARKRQQHYSRGGRVCYASRSRATIQICCAAAFLVS
jgi:hypothetical protein